MLGVVNHATILYALSIKWNDLFYLSAHLTLVLLLICYGHIPEAGGLFEDTCNA